MARIRLLLVCFALMGIHTGLHPQSWSGVLAPSRAIDWSGAGTSGGIPTGRTQCGAIIAAYSGPAAAINRAIAACPPQQVVQLAAGTFHLTDGVVINSHNDVILRGMGADKTFLIFTAPDHCQGVQGDICVESSDSNWSATPTNGPVNWTAGYARGSTVITLESVANLAVGNPIVLDQLDDETDDGGVYVCSSKGPTCSLQGGGGGQRPGRGQYQIVTVKGCNGSTEPGFHCSGKNVAVTIDRGLDMPNWNATKAPQAWWASHPVSGVGIEDLSLDHTVGNQALSTEGISFFNATSSWVKGVRSIDSQRAHVGVVFSSHITVRDSYFFLTQSHIFVSYGVDCFTSSDLLVENNIFQAVVGPMMMNACTGSVFGYNFAVNDYYTAGPGWLLPMSNAHAGGVEMILQEGNVGPRFDSDNFHGSHHFVTEFRNRWSGYGPKCWASGATYATAEFEACLHPPMASQLLPYSRFYNYVGNVLGTPGVQTSYENGPAPIYFIGKGPSDQGVTIQDDPNVETTLMRWGNYDTVSAASRFAPEEVPSKLTGVQAPFSNPVPASKILPASFYLTAKPEWWPAAKAWPPIGPDVTSGNVPGLDGHANTVPAEDCYLKTMHGEPDGTGGPLAFNADACYGPSKR